MAITKSVGNKKSLDYNYTLISIDDLNEMRNVVIQMKYQKSPLECRRYLSVQLIHYMRSTGSSNFADIYYGRPDSSGWDPKWRWARELSEAFNDFHKYEEQRGYTWSPIEVNTIFQLLSVNDVNLNQEYLDATVAISMQWMDGRLKWDYDTYGKMEMIRLTLVASLCI